MFSLDPELDEDAAVVVPARVDVLEDQAIALVGLEDVASLNADMTRTQSITISGFLLLSLGTLLFALWLFNRFMLSPLGVMVNGMRRIADGNVSMSVNSRGLTEFQMLADTFNTMANTVRMRTNDLKRLLDMDDSAIVCFDNDAELVFFNKAASSLFGSQSINTPLSQ